ncbi:MAG: O-acetyl-ADP-ribose deacetylase [Acidobacteria bacterium]|nr:O-acetyl-ADP-ribose deacetylase [Acidobacteriota bacterium]
MQQEFLNERVIVKVGDITQETCDAIVNAANSSLLGGGGVDGAIHAQSGQKILEECREIRRKNYPNGLPTGEAVITSGGNLKAKFVIHTVGPVYSEHRGREAELLANCYRNSLALASENNLETIAFPAVSTGIYGYPKQQAANISSKAVKNFLAQNEQIKQVRFVFFSMEDAEIFLKNHIF